MCDQKIIGQTSLVFGSGVPPVKALRILTTSLVPKLSSQPGVHAVQCYSTVQVYSIINSQGWH